MSNDNYPAGVTDAHPHFNPSETYIEVECTTEEALVVPSFAIKADLNHLYDYVTQMIKLGHDSTSQIMGTVAGKIELMQERVTALEQEREYECSWKGEMELPVSEEAEWDCPRCGAENTEDTLPADDWDEDAYDRMRDARYDD